ncbi:hypothetical protein ISS42_01395 [Candidatus Shapirobacteria bacterium]|nr:hypothetical protein [Candidatus Shapirobacteria bacterium]
MRISGKFFLHLIYLFLAVVTTFVWTQHPTLSFYNLQLIAALIIVWFLKQKLFSKEEQNTARKTLDALILTIVILMLVFATGGANSPLFFLIYFLLFGLSFLFEPPITITLAFILLVFLTPSVKTSNEVASLLSLFLITPLALYFGRLYLQNLTSEKRAELYQEKWVESEKHLGSQEINVLLWLSLKLKPGLEEVLDRTSLMLCSLSKLSPSQKSDLKIIRKKSQHLLKGAEKLQRLVDIEAE